jgi:hypothetical protein
MVRDIALSTKFGTEVLGGEVADIHACYEMWRCRGADFLTPCDQRAELPSSASGDRVDPRKPGTPAN